MTKNPPQEPARGMLAGWGFIRPEVYHQSQMELAAERGLLLEAREREKRLLAAIAHLEEEIRLLRQLLGEEKEEKKALRDKAIQYESAYRALMGERQRDLTSVVATGRQLPHVDVHVATDVTHGRGPTVTGASARAINAAPHSGD